MKEKNREQILKELIKQVIKKDQEIEARYEKEAIKNATKEALIEMTEMSLDEINKIESDIIRKNYIEAKIKNRKKNFIITVLIFIFIIIVVGVFIYKYYASKQNFDKLIFVENFDDNSNNWKIFEYFSFKKYFEDDKFIFETNKSDKCFLAGVNIDLPEMFTMELTTTWIQGRFEKYGFILEDTSQLHASYYLYPENKAYIHTMYDGTWVKFPITSASGKNTNIQKIVATSTNKESRTFNYYVNDLYIDNYNFYDFSVENKLQLKVCDAQKVSFDFLKITDNKTGKVVLNSSFGDLKNDIEEDMYFKLISSIENGQYIFRTNKKEKCYSSMIFREIKNYAKIKLTSTWLDGENYYYGLKLADKNGDFYTFELKPDGTTSFLKVTDGKTVVFIDNIATSCATYGEAPVEQTVILKNNIIEYYVNDKLEIWE